MSAAPGTPGTDWPWSTLGLDATGDAVAIKRAYAALLKRTRPDDDPAGYQALRAAYDAALERAGARPRTAGIVQPPPATPAMDEATDEPQDTFAPQRATAAHAEQVLADFFANPPTGNRRAADWEGLRAALDALPLQRRADVSLACAEAILGNFHLSSRIALELDRYFQWSSDYRVSERLGQTRLRDLRTWMREHEVRLRQATSLDGLLADGGAQGQAGPARAPQAPRAAAPAAPVPKPSWWRRLLP